MRKLYDGRESVARMRKAQAITMAVGDRSTHTLVCRWTWRSNFGDDHGDDDGDDDGCGDEQDDKGDSSSRHFLTLS